MRRAGKMRVPATPLGANVCGQKEGGDRISRVVQTVDSAIHRISHYAADTY